MSSELCVTSLEELATWCDRNSPQIRLEAGLEFVMEQTHEQS